MAIAHTITDLDTLQSLATQYFGDISQWQTIADYNKLDYPYLLKDASGLTDLYGHGYVKVVRANYSTAITIKKGWTFKTKPSIFVGGIAKTFEVAQDTVIPAGQSTYYIPLKCTVPGTYGNVMEYTITEVGDDTKAVSTLQILSVYNEQSFTGGRDLNVKITGDVIYIPIDTSEVMTADISRLAELIGGEDLLVGDDGEFISQASGDLASVSGLDNIQYAVTARLATELRELPAHPTYGTELEELVGTPNLFNREKLAIVAVQRALKQESRIKEVAVNNLTVINDKIYLDISYKVAVNNADGRLQLTI